MIKYTVAEDIDWINKRAGNYRCLVCGYQEFDGKPGAHLREHEKEEADNHEYAFDVTLTAVVRVQAKSVDSAREKLKQIDSVSADVKAGSDMRITEVSLRSVGDSFGDKPFEIDGEPTDKK
jgi:hypothetical protein